MHLDDRGHAAVRLDDAVAHVAQVVDVDVAIRARGDQLVGGLVQLDLEHIGVVLVYLTRDERAVAAAARRLTQVEDLDSALAEAGVDELIVRGQAGDAAGHLGGVVLVQLLAHVPDAYEAGVAGAHQRLGVLLPVEYEAGLLVGLASLAVAERLERGEQLTLGVVDQIGLEYAHDAVVGAREKDGLVLHVHELERGAEGLATRLLLLLWRSTTRCV